MTIKELADELGMTKQGIRKYVSQLPQTLVHKDGKGIIQLNDEAARLIKEKAEAKRKPVTGKLPVTEPATETPVTTLITMLQRELETKNGIIESQQQSIHELTAALESTTASLHAAQALHAGTMQKQIAGGEQAEEEGKKKGFFGLFRK